MGVFLCGEVCGFYLVFTVETMSRENTGSQECFSEAHRILVAQSAPLLSVDLLVSMHFFQVLCALHIAVSPREVVCLNCWPISVPKATILSIYFLLIV